MQVTCNQDDLHHKQGASVLQVSHTPLLALHTSKCILHNDSTLTDVGVAVKVCICESPVVTLGGDDEGKILKDVSTIPQQMVTSPPPHLLLPVLEKWGGPQHSGNKRPSASTILWKRTE